MRIKTLLIGLLCLLLWVACDDYDKWTTAANARLEFSQDTVRFDTLITGQSSSTKTLIAFNKGGEGLRRMRVALKNGDSSRFRVNVDGQFLYAGQGEDFEVRRKDSLVVRIEALLPPGGDATIRHYEDELTFTLESGVSQSIRLEADGMDVKILRGKVIEQDETLGGDMPFLIYDSLVVNPGATLTLEKGTRLLFHDKVSLQVHGSLKAVGTQEEPIIFRGDRTDRMFPYLPYDNTPNRWGGIHFYADSRSNLLEQCDIHSGDYGILCDSIEAPDSLRPVLTLRHSVVHNVGGPGLSLFHTSAWVEGTQISNTLGQCVSILGGDVTLVHCTLAQFYPFSAQRQEALYLSNLGENDAYVHLEKAHFLNCVITGYADDVILGHLLPENDYYCNYLFANCLLRTVESNDKERFREVVYDNKDLEPVNYHDHFTLFDTHDFLYDFAPVDSSSISTLGNPEYSRKFCPVDRRGKPFVREDGKAASGAYAATSPASDKNKLNP